MPEAQTIEKAYLQEVTWTQDNAVPVGEKIKVQFNPQTLKLSFTNQKTGGDQRGSSAIQFLGKSATKLSLDLLFDVTAPLADGTVKQDVRELTQSVVDFLKPKKKIGEQYIPPGVRFGWGSFLFDGVMDSVNETLEFFSNEGKPLRATVSIALSRQDIYFKIERSTVSGAPAVPGTLPVIETRTGDTIQQMAARAGSRYADWIPAALANNIENPRQLTPGTLLDLSAGTSQRRRMPGGLNAEAALEAGKQLLGDPSRALNEALGSRSVEALGLQAARELRNRITNPR